MKSRVKHIFCIAALLTLCASASVLAQDAGMSDTEVSTPTTTDRAAFTPGEDVRYIPRATGVYAPSDSVTLQIQDFPMQRAAQRPADKPAEKQPKKDDSILTFNFLYYIIQKYKLQDIID